MKKIKLNIQKFATVLNNKRSDGRSPYAYYTLEATYSNRTATTVDISVTVTANLASSSSSLGTGPTTGLTAWFNFFGGQYRSLELKGTNERWSGTTKHYKSETYTISNLTANTSNIDIQFKVDRTGSAVGTSDTSIGAWLAWTKCSSLSIETGTKYVPVMTASLQQGEVYYNMTNNYAWINWNCTSDSSVSSINQLQITYRVTGQNATTIYKDVSGKSGSFQLTGLNGNTSYQVSVYGRSSDGIWSTSAANVNFTTYANPINISSIEITDLQTTSVTVSVTPSTTNNLDQYHYEVLNLDGGYVTSSYSRNNVCTLNGLSPETTYNVYATAIPYNQGPIEAPYAVRRFTTLTDQASIFVKTSGGWVKGKAFVKATNGWQAAKKVFVKTNSGWNGNINS